MAKRLSPVAETKKAKKSQDIFKSVTPDDAKVILETLASEDPGLRKKIEFMLIDLLGEVGIDELAGEVFSELDTIQVEDLWDRSGSTRDGYVEPCEESWEMFDEGLAPFILDMERFQNLGQFQKAKNYGMGILQGIYQFAHESKSEFVDWAPDAPLDRFMDILKNWKESFTSDKDHRTMQKFLIKGCPKWSQRL